MATLTVIDAESAPKRVTATPAALLRRQAEYEGYLKAVKKGQVGRLSPTRGETARSLSSRVAWAGRRTGKAVDRWIVDDVLYFKVTD